MKLFTIKIKHNGKIFTFETTANTEFDAKQIIKGKLLNMLSEAEVTQKGFVSI